MATPNPPGYCDECENVASQLCGGCRSSLYCSRACQKIAWSTHKHLCKTFKDFQDQHRPAATDKGEKYSRAILFDPARAHPQFIWLKSRNYCTDSIELEDLSDEGALSNVTKAKFTNDNVCDKRIEFVHNKLLDRYIGHVVYISYRDNYFNDGSEFNDAVAGISDSASKYLHAWGGPIIAHSTNNPMSLVDLVPSDLRHIGDFLTSFKYSAVHKVEDYDDWYASCDSDDSDDFDRPRRPLKLSLYEEFRKIRSARKNSMEEKLRGKKVTAVRINCNGDVTVDNRPRYEACEIFNSHPIFQQAATDISQHVDLPILVRRIPGSVDTWAKRNDVPTSMVPWVNTAGTFLNIGCQPERENDFPNYSWAWAPMYWQNSVGAVLVARQDKKDLLPGHVEALAEYNEEYLMPFFQTQMESEYCEDENLILDKHYVMKEVGAEKFEEYFQGWKLRQTDPVKQQTASPYV